MKIPETMKIGHAVYTVKIVDDLRGEYDRNATLFGEVSYTAKEIRLRADNSPEQMVSTLIHECLHVLDEQVLVAGLSEKTIKRLGAGLAMLLLDNNLLKEG